MFLNKRVKEANLTLTHFRSEIHYQQLMINSQKVAKKIMFPLKPFFPLSFPESLIFLNIKKFFKEEIYSFFGGVNPTKSYPKTTT